MCDKKHCGRFHGDICSCAPIRNGDPFEMAVHLASHMSDVDWDLTYRDLEHIAPYRLCLIGKCAKCGGRLCVEQKPFDCASADDFLAAAYRHLYQFHQNMGQPLCREVFREKFVRMFHENDRPVVRGWLDRTENNSLHSVLCKDTQKVYTIVHTRADTDRAKFPPPEGMSSHTEQSTAREYLRRLVEQEKDAMEFPYTEEQYREDYGDDFREAYCDGYAAGWFTRYEIIESPLFMEKEGE